MQYEAATITIVVPLSWISTLSGSLGTICALPEMRRKTPGGNIIFFNSTGIGYGNVCSASFEGGSASETSEHTGMGRPPTTNGRSFHRIASAENASAVCCE